MSTDRELLLQAIEKAQPTLARFAREGYALAGRGLIQASLPPTPEPGATVTTMMYRSASDLRRSTADVIDHLREDRDIIVRMIETYDPEREAVVTIAFAYGNSITVKLHLDLPFIVEEAERSDIEKGWAD